MDVHVRGEITEGLRRRGVDVLTAQEDDTDTLADAQLLDRAGALDRLLFSQDEDLLVEAVSRQRSGRAFRGVIYAHQLNITIGQAVDDLELIAQASDLSAFAGQVVYLPLK